MSLLRSLEDTFCDVSNKYRQLILAAIKNQRLSFSALLQQLSKITTEQINPNTLAHHLQALQRRGLVTRFKGTPTGGTEHYSFYAITEKGCEALGVLDDPEEMRRASPTALGRAEKENGNSLEIQGRTRNLYARVRAKSREVSHRDVAQVPSRKRTVPTGPHLGPISVLGPDEQSSDWIEPMLRMKEFVYYRDASGFWRIKNYKRHSRRSTMRER